MPSASDEDRALMTKWFGSIDTHGPEAFLKSHGYVLTKDWCWVKPTPSHEISAIEDACLWFLLEEWDYGGLISEEQATACTQLSDTHDNEGPFLR